MGTYDDLLTLQKTSTVVAPEPPKTAESVAPLFIPPRPKKDPVKAPTKPRVKSTVPLEPDDDLEDQPPTRLPTTVFKKRNITRGSFEIYQDQLHVLRQVSLTAKLTGDDLSISEMVREALDEYIHRKDLKP